MAYRPKGELEKWKEMDPIKRFEDFLINNINLPVKTVKGIKKEVGKKIEAAVRFAEESPDVKAEDALSGIYA
jgi:TPP-dependent pyruvate/acetoin dehydrogenase alpha subunit